MKIAVVLSLASLGVASFGVAAEPAAVRFSGGRSLQADAVSVMPGRQVELTFRARVVVGPTLEEHPEYADLVPISVSRPTVSGIRFASVNRTFLDADGRKVARPYEGGQPITLFSRKWRTFAERLWIPAGVVAVKVHPVPGDKKNKVELADVAVWELPDDGTLFSSPSFEDIYCPFGWRLVGGALYLTDAEGRGVVSTDAGHANSEAFPVVPGSRVEVRVCGAVSPRANRPKSNYWMHFAPDYDAMRQAKGFKKSLAPLSIVKNQTTAVREFLVPEGMTWARVAAWNGDLKGLEVRQIRE